MFHLASAPAVNMSNEEGRVEELRAADGFAKKGFGREFEERFSSCSPQTADCEFFSAYLGMDFYRVVGIFCKKISCLLPR